jgi:aconitate decarboxylase
MTLANIRKFPCTNLMQRLGPLAAAILNSTFIQGFELDDYHSEAPLHSNAIILPAVLAAAELMKSKAKTVSGSSLLLATISKRDPIVGFLLASAHASHSRI